MLEKGGCEVVFYGVSNDSIRGVAAAVRTGFRLTWNDESAAEVRAIIARERPDVVHVHNFFPLLTFSVHQAAHECGVAVVQTLHNYRLLCAAAIFARKGEVCELCLHGSRLNALRFRCYRGSALGTASVINMQRVNSRDGLLAQNVHRFIALTEFARKKFIEGGLPGARIVVKPNFLAVDSSVPRLVETPRTGALFVGRLSEEKGLDVLLDAWADLESIPLRIVGDGPMRDKIVTRLPKGVTYLGRLSPEEVRAEMSSASVLVQPSTCYEGLPMTVVEAFSVGLPVIASQIGSLAEIVVDGVTGLLTAPNSASELRAAVISFFADPAASQKMGHACRVNFEAVYSENINFAKTIEIYQEAIALASEGR